ncbi:glycosyltransferase family 2 protein [uncultured Methanobrevibacter sp.]|uniref:glycosyltransferase family 2 protein n=1 Tax=uncultured Methanobrevibacter sp. TaxID=253161 RepID=UPI0025F1252F|nr:glycosyltransferase family 2 protein [uncultured Methanobrevibacter sp.]
MGNDVTIAIPLYKAKKYIKECLNSALVQSYPYIDFLVIDDAGDDGSVDFVVQMQAGHPRGKDIRLIRHTQNVGIGKTRNHLIAEAKTKYLFFLDADDIIAENAIQILHDAAEKYQTDLVYGSHEQIDMTKVGHHVIPFLYEQLFLKYDDYPIYVYRKYEGIQATIWNALINLEWFRSTGLRFLPINYWEDFALTMDLATYASRVVLLSDVTYYYYRHSGSLSIAKDSNRYSKENIQKTIGAIEWVKGNSDRIKQKSYFPGRMVKVLMTDFYIVCNVLKNKDRIQPAFSKRELRDVMKSPLTFKETISLKSRRFENLFLYMLGVLPSSISIWIITILGKHRRLI